MDTEGFYKELQRDIVFVPCNILLPFGNTLLLKVSLWQSFANILSDSLQWSMIQKITKVMKEKMMTTRKRILDTRIKVWLTRPIRLGPPPIVNFRHNLFLYINTSDDNQQ